MIIIQFSIFIGMLAFIIFKHEHSLKIAAIGTAVLIVVTQGAAFVGVADVADFSFPDHIKHHGHLLFNIFTLLLGFTLMADLFETSGFIHYLQRFLPKNLWGPFVLLIVVFFLSIFLDNIASAIIGAIIAKTLFKDRVHIGYLVAIVAASNAGGAGSVIGDTTSTILWLSGVHPLTVLKALFPAMVAMSIFGYSLSKLQYAHQPLESIDTPKDHSLDYKKLGIVAVCIVGIFTGNINWDLPGLGLWLAIGAGAFFVKVRWSLLRVSVKDATFLCLLITAATILPTSFLPTPDVVSTSAIGIISAFFDNIPLTVLAVEQDNQDWGLLAYALGFGGSMMWFGSSAGVALCSLFPYGKNALNWVRYGWPIFFAYCVGCAAYVLVFGFNPVPIAQAGTFNW